MATAARATYVQATLLEKNPDPKDIQKSYELLEGTDNESVNKWALLSRLAREGYTTGD